MLFLGGTLRDALEDNGLGPSQPKQLHWEELGITQQEIYIGEGKENCPSASSEGRK